VSTFFIVLSTVSTVISTLPSLYEYKDIFNGIEVFTIAWFNFEYLVRFLSAPRKCRFLTKAWSIIDFLSILPFYVNLVISSSSLDKEHARHAISFFKILRFIRILRLLKNSQSLQAFMFAVKTSNLNFYIVVIIINVTLFSSLVYYAEQEEKTFDSILSAMW